jgi:hypothetical protein
LVLKYIIIMDITLFYFRALIPQKSTKMLVVANSLKESYKAIGHHQSFYIRILHHEHFENITSTFNENKVLG